MSQDTALMLRKNSALVPLTGSLDAYIAAVNNIPALDFDQEQALARQLTEEQNLDAAQQMVLANLRHVVHIARGYLGYGLPFADLIQEGNIGLMKAVKRFDPDVGVRLISFAVHWIKAEIHEYILKNWRIVKVATTKAQRKLFFNLRKNKKRLGWMNKQEVDNIARDLNVKPEEVLQMESRLYGHDVSFAASPSEEDSYAPEDYLAQDGDPFEAMEDAEWNGLQEDRMRRALTQLDERSRDIIASRWLHDGNKQGLKELAQKYGVSAERIRQIEVAAMKKLRKAIEPATDTA